MPISDTGFWVDVDLEHEHAFDPSLAAALRELARQRGVRTLYDFGCGMGEYVKTLRAAGLDATGYDGNPLTSTFANCSVADLTDSAFVQPPVDGVLCLEVGEHVPAEYEAALLHTIDRHVRPGGLLVLSWAIPGQGGLGHVNCKTNANVRERITQMGYIAHPDLEQRLRTAATIGWFKHTILVFTKFPLVHTDLSGGVGNQLFQIATCLARGTQPCLCGRTLTRAPLSSLFDSLPRSCAGTEPFVPASGVQRYTEITSALPHLRRLLPPPPVEAEDAVFLHVRGGDYVGHSFHHVPLTSYYERAVRHFPPETLFRVLTNDSVYADQVLPRESRTELLDLDDAEAFQTMRACRGGGICANSSFSWWAGALNPDRTLVIPSRWTNSVDWNRSSDYRVPGAIVEEVGIDAYCIHLPHRTDRVRHIDRIRTQYPSVQIHLVDAIRDDNGDRGCILSHKKAIAYAKEQNLPYLLVLEDDCEMLLSESEFAAAVRDSISYLHSHPTIDIVNGCGNLPTLSATLVDTHGTTRFLTAPAIRTTHCILYSARAYDRFLAISESTPIDVQTNTLSMVFTYPYLATQAPSYSDLQRKDVSYENIERSRAFVKNLLEPPVPRQKVHQPVNLRPVFRIPIRTKRV